jgi:plasmid stabilization system protein ParE
VKLRYTRCASAELKEILAHIEMHSPQGARNVKTRIQEVILLLTQHPQAGPVTSVGRLRRIVASPYPYLIFYEARDAEIVIHGVRHGSRRPSSMPQRHEAS